MAAWGEGFFGVNDSGHVCVRPDPRTDARIDLAAVVDEVVAGGLSLPAVIRFQDVLATRVRALNGAFAQATAEAGYGGGYTSVYPVKVNQLREVVDEIVEAGREFNCGIECGSKAELVATLPRLESDDTLCLVNGYKDAAMLRLILTFQRLGRRVLPIVEKVSELEQILALADEAGQEPAFGIRVKLAAVAPGPWTRSGGSLSKFGVSLPELVALADRLIEEGRPQALKLLHFHLGSQIGDVGALKAGVREIARVYAGLVRRGLRPEFLDVGGGLGVNYEALPLGSGASGVDYSVQEYANAVVYAAKEVCDAEQVPEPRLITENGRAVTAHHSVLVVDVLGATQKPTVPDDFELPASAHAVAAELDALRQSVPQAGGLGELLEVLHDANEARGKAQALFQYGYLDLDAAALTERLYWAVCRRIHDRVEAAAPEWTPPELDALGDALADQLLCDFSVFQSLMDHWALGQRFPIAPIARLERVPERRARGPFRLSRGRAPRARRPRPSGRRPDGALPARGLPRRRVPGHPRRRAQPLRRRQRGARLPRRRRALGLLRGGDAEGHDGGRDARPRAVFPLRSPGPRAIARAREGPRRRGPPEGGPGHPLGLPRLFPADHLPRPALGPADRHRQPPDSHARLRPPRPRPDVDGPRPRRQPRPRDGPHA